MTIRHSRSRRVSGCLCAATLVAALSLAACTNGDTAAPADDGAGTPTPPDTADTSDTADSGDATDAENTTPCHSQQRRAINRSRTWHAAREVSRSVTGSSAAASRIMGRDANRAAERLQEACGNLPTAASVYLQVVRGQAVAPMGDAELNVILDAWLRWASTIDHAAYVQDTIDYVRDCREYEKDITVTHRVLWAWTDTGKRWWIELTFDNRTGRQALGSTAGRTRVTGAQPAGGYPPLTYWGGSSADGLFVRPGVSHVQPLGLVGVQTTSDGTFEVRDIWVGLVPPGLSLPCDLPVPQSP